jgi:hypothetical protein
MKRISTWIMTAVALAALSLTPVAFAGDCCKDGAACCKEGACCKKEGKACCKDGASCCTGKACPRTGKH